MMWIGYEVRGGHCSRMTRKIELYLVLSSSWELYIVRSSRGTEDIRASVNCTCSILSALLRHLASAR